ncbi:hypothetical protein A2Y85_08780 [candidate division WOR-3 bacterium RBG_13_43_14]|uniref:Gingipain domain-containing protein n=1 Tax=candidate division WOR-3 bacterium RBG_13_43_14 TaxID=1802590 RepID=A0A1F4U4L7_UNCW3|nr:MAG: hypothetical protein A2Y85_08780 [candidate division WOR-3 bacterium RBG_13_43_14]
MCKVNRVAMLIMGFAFGATSEWVGVLGSSGSSTPPMIDCTKSDMTAIHINMAFFGFNSTDTTADSKNFVRIEIPNGYLQQVMSNDDSIIVGKPQIPYIKLLLAVPDSATLNVTINESSPQIFDDYLLYPIPRVEFIDSSGWMGSYEEYAYDTSFYETDTMYPDKFYEIVEDGHWRDQRVIEVHLFPVQFNPSKEFMYFYNGFDFRIEYSGTIVQNTRGLGPFEQIAREVLVNYEGIDNQVTPSPTPDFYYYYNLDTTNIADYIIVINGAIYAHEQSTVYIEKLADWRVDHNGFDVGIVMMDSIYSQFNAHAPDSAAMLRDFLIYAYENWRAPSMADSHFAYSLFIGDWDYVPIKLAQEYYNGIGYWNAFEGYYRDLSSPTDGFEDIMLGRLPIKLSGPSAFLSTIINKIVDYEGEPTTGDWRRRGLLIAGPGDGYGLFETKINEAKPFFTNIDYDTLVVDHFVAATFPDVVDSCLNRGEIITAFYGHGGPYGWNYNYGNWYAESLQNNDSLSVIYSYACRPGFFHWDHPVNDYVYPYDTLRVCFGEVMLKNPEGGAIAFYGATSPIWISLYNTIPIRNVLQMNHWSLGESVINTTPNTRSNCFCILGDPALDMGDYTAYPDLPDLMVRPHFGNGNDISIMNHPYHTSGDSIQINAKIWNIGGEKATNVLVRFEVVGDEGLICSDTATIDTILPRDTVVVAGYWNTASTHPNHYGEIGDCDFTIKVDPNDNIEESWEYNNQTDTTLNITLYPNEDNWPKKIFVANNRFPPIVAQPEIVNLDGSGNAEIVFVSNDSVYAFTNSGSNCLGWPKYFPGVYSFVAGDLNCTGNPEIIAVSQESVKVYASNGSILNGWPVCIPGVDTMRLFGFPAIGYIEGTDQYQVVVYAGNKDEGQPHKPKVFVYDYDGDLLYSFTASDYSVGSYSNGASISDINADGNEEIIVSYEYHRFSNMTWIDSGYTEIFNKNGHVRTLEWGSVLQTSALVDLDSPADGYPEMITGSVTDTIWAYKERTQDTLWKSNTGYEIRSSPAVGNIANTTGNEVSFGNDGNWIWLKKCSDGEDVGDWPYSTEGPVQTSPALARLEGQFDMFVDIVVAGNDLIVYGTNYGKNDISPYPLPVFHLASSPVIGDIDGDYKSETVIATADGYLHVWENVSSTCTRYLLEWPQYHHDYKRTGLYGWAESVDEDDCSPQSFSTATTISFRLKRDAEVNVAIFDNNGNKVKSLVNQELTAGKYHPIWYGDDNNYNSLSNGVYFIVIAVDNDLKVMPVEIAR